MSWILAIAVFSCLASGLYLALSRDLLRVVLGLALLGSGVNLMLFGAGRINGPLPAVIPLGEATLAAGMGNPLPQALVLTAIVIGFSLVCFSLVLALAVLRAQSTDDIDAMRDAEPVPTDPVKPPYPDARLEAPLSMGDSK